MKTPIQSGGEALPEKENVSPDTIATASAYELCNAMERPLDEAAELSRAVLMIAAEHGDQEASVICTLAGLVLERCRQVAKMREDVFRATHPSRSHFERVGWPGAAS